MCKERLISWYWDRDLRRIVIACLDVAPIIAHTAQYLLYPRLSLATCHLLLSRR